MLTTRNCHFNPRSLTGATFDIHVFSTQISISIHAPSRERRCCSISIGIPHIFQSTLPRGSDCNSLLVKSYYVNFNPRSLAGATPSTLLPYSRMLISIHAPSRERRGKYPHRSVSFYFNPRSLAGATLSICFALASITISIHAPSRERLRDNA